MEHQHEHAGDHLQILHGMYVLEQVAHMHTLQDFVTNSLIQHKHPFCFH